MDLVKTNQIQVGGHFFSDEQIIEQIGPFLTDVRKNKIENVLSKRCSKIPIILEDIYDAGNIFAVFRSAESLGFQHVHLIEQEIERKKLPNRSRRNSQKWLSIHDWHSTTKCIHHLRSENFKIAATDVSASMGIDEIDFSRPTAVLFGNEHHGVQQNTLEMADYVFKVPMQGFTESFNISVAVAISLYHIYQERQHSPGGHADLSNDDKKNLRARFYLRSYEHAEQLLKKGKLI